MKTRPAVISAFSSASLKRVFCAQNEVDANKRAAAEAHAKTQQTEAELQEIQRKIQEMEEQHNLTPPKMSLQQEADLKNEVKNAIAEASHSSSKELSRDVYDKLIEKGANPDEIKQQMEESGILLEGQEYEAAADEYTPDNTDATPDAGTTPEVDPEVPAAHVIPDAPKRSVGMGAM